ncbi:MAG: membrane protein insertion efficiency factor YidD [Gammaproteobacteria bacterium]
MRWLSRGIVQLFLALIATYRYCISPLLGYHCRFTPSCSEYAAQAFREHGVFHGLKWSVLRILRCHPWGGSGHDPVP